MKRTLSDYSSLRAAEYNDSQINAAWLDTRQQSFRGRVSNHAALIWLSLYSAARKEL